MGTESTSQERTLENIAGAMFESPSFCRQLAKAEKWSREQDLPFEFVGYSNPERLQWTRPKRILRSEPWYGSNLKWWIHIAVFPDLRITHVLKQLDFNVLDYDVRSSTSGGNNQGVAPVFGVASLTGNQYGHLALIRRECKIADGIVRLNTWDYMASEAFDVHSDPYKRLSRMAIPGITSSALLKYDIKTNNQACKTT